MSLPFSLSLGFDGDSEKRIDDAIELLNLTTGSRRLNDIPHHINIAENLREEEVEKVAGAMQNYVNSSKLECNGILILGKEEYMIMARWKEVGIASDTRTLAKATLGKKLEPNDETNGYKWLAKTTLITPKDIDLKINRVRLKQAEDRLKEINVDRIMSIYYCTETKETKIVKDFKIRITM